MLSTAHSADPPIPIVAGPALDQNVKPWFHKEYFRVQTMASGRLCDPRAGLSLSGRVAWGRDQIGFAAFDPMAERGGQK
ncbi:hypothetical protein [Gemmobacter serpentinus]|uniref:hypothetical protein n=1 Tax=Gemmobacter serpentinus TaxID=2652247 RepID=UPI00124EA2CB|nr:hypothetical protein [Gemmobacter serpentinus]